MGRGPMHNDRRFWLRQRIQDLHSDEGGTVSLEELLILAAIVLPLLGLLIFFRDQVARWLKEIWDHMKIDPGFSK
jgi:hypothetical protein